MSCRPHRYPTTPRAHSSRPGSTLRLVRPNLNGANSISPPLAEHSKPSTSPCKLSGGYARVVVVEAFVLVGQHKTQCRPHPSLNARSAGPLQVSLLVASAQCVTVTSAVCGPISPIHASFPVWNVRYGARPETSTPQRCVRVRLFPFERVA